MPRHSKRSWRDPILGLIDALTRAAIAARFFIDRAETRTSKYFRDKSAAAILTEALALLTIFGLLATPPALLVVGIIIL